nr:unnamed protein product [Trichobilharzia regenti]
MSEREADSNTSRVVIGPALRPDDIAPSSGIGPALPTDLFRQKLAKEPEVFKSQDDFEDMDTIGPLIPGQELREEWRHLKSGHSGGSSRPVSDKPKRDAWMTELLPMSNDLGALKPRKFRQDISSHSVHHDASWFTAPNDSSETLEAAKEPNDKLSFEGNKSYDQSMAKIASQYQGSSKKSSLLEIHEKKLKQKLKKHKEKSKKHKHKSKKHKKKHEKSPSPDSIRRPFDREKDLKLFRVDAAARKAIVERSKQLSSRFSHGKQQYL